MKNAYGSLGMLTYGVFLSDNVLLHTAARTPTLLVLFNWELLATLSNYHFFTFLKNWLRSQPFNKYENLMEVVKTWQKCLS
jgi:hypothetical protein